VLTSMLGGMGGLAVASVVGYKVVLISGCSKHSRRLRRGISRAGITALVQTTHKVPLRDQDGYRLAQCFVYSILVGSSS
jgi:hypothetical protein